MDELVIANEGRVESTDFLDRRAQVTHDNRDVVISHTIALKNQRIFL